MVFSEAAVHKSAHSLYFAVKLEKITNTTVTVPFFAIMVREWLK